MASGVTKIADIIVPSVFTGYSQQITEKKSRLIQSGAVVRDPAIDALLAGGGLIFNVPSFKDLDDDTENVSTDNDGSASTPMKIGTAKEMAVRMNRNQSWSDMDLAGDLAGADPLAAIGTRVGAYWARRAQAAFIAECKGLFADNDAAPSGTDTHTQYDLRVDISNGGTYAPGSTDFSAEAALDAIQTMGDSQEDLRMIFVHSVVYTKMKKNNLIDFVQDSANPLAQRIPTFLGQLLVVDDTMPVPATGTYETWFFGPGAVRWGVGTPDVPTAVERKESAGDGGGQSILYNRVLWTLHPAGHAYIGTAPNGGPSNAATSNNLAAAGSWSRVFPERKQIKIARLITQEA